MNLKKKERPLPAAPEPTMRQQYSRGGKAGRFDSSLGVARRVGEGFLP